jgi:23S rRNA (uracil1939-C5)-methyltransferase
VRNNTKQETILEKVEIIDAGSEGKAVARIDNLVIFVNNAVPGDIADLKITRKKRNYREATAIKFHQLSTKRTEAFCTHFGTCGGCKWQHMDYSHQLFYKQKQVEENLARIGKVELPEILPILPSEKTQYYRNKLEYTFSNKRWLTQDEIINQTEIKDKNALGFHIPGMFDKILEIDTCFLQEEPSNSMRLEVKKYALENKLSFFDIKEQHGLLRNIIIRSTSKGEWMVLLSFYYEDKEAIEGLLNHLKKHFPQLTSLLFVINSKKNDTISDLDIMEFSGRDHIIEEMDGLSFKISAKSFFQTNSFQALNLYRITRDFADIKENEVVYDLYTGTGTIANFIAKYAKRVIGIEYVPQAIEDANINSSINGITNTNFFAGDMKDILNEEFIKQNGRPDVIITDPPRAGMHEDVVKRINESGAERVVYVSCNPATQARDLALMNDFYKIEKVQPVDMFPHTHHVENVILMRKR